MPRSEALDILEVKPSTLYSYVSRGLVRRVVDPNGRTSYYSRQDVQRLKSKSLARSGHGPAAAGAMQWGAPVLTTSITDISPEGPRYRDHLALDLARRDVSFERVAEYLWTGHWPAPSVWPVALQTDDFLSQLSDILRYHVQLDVRRVMTEVVLLLGPDEESGANIRLMQAMAGALGFLGPEKAFARLSPGDTIARVLAQALGIEATPARLQALNAALVLVADHELTPATFAARIAASAGSDLYSCIAAALPVYFSAALGLSCDRVEQTLDALVSRDGAVSFDDMLAAIRTPNGADHPVYAERDPRAQWLIALARGLLEGSSADEGEADGITLDAALVIFCRSLGAGRHAAGAMLAFARTAGWIAHIIEQRQQGFVMRPRGQFVGTHGD
jgi:citrate synthase